MLSLCDRVWRRGWDDLGLLTRTLLISVTVTLIPFPGFGAFGHRFAESESLVQWLS